MLSDVSTALSGFVRANNGLRYIQDRNFVIRQELSKGKVKLISGGGSGHEPAFAGYVGKGMLDAAVCGDVFCSPSATSIVDCLRMVAQPDESVLFIVNNYTGDRLNFGLAIERARTQYGYRRLQMTLVDDDCSILDSMVQKSVGKRGLAGCVLMIKILGAMAEMGRSMDDMISFGETLLREGWMATFGFSFDVVDNKLDNIEMGKGVHGEPGVYKMDPSKDFDPLLYFALDRMARKIEPYKDHPVVVLVNNLGGTSELVLGVFMQELLTKLTMDYTIKRVYVGRFFTSLDNSGLSVTLLNLNYSHRLERYLDYEVQVASPFFGGASLHGLPPSEVRNFLDEELYKVLSAAPWEYNLRFDKPTQLKVRDILENIAKSLVSNRDLLNMYDDECGDGDTGNTIAKGAEALLAGLDSKLLKLHFPATMFQDMSEIIQRSVGGTTGALYSLFFHAASKAFIDADRSEELSLDHWLMALTLGNDTIVKYAYTQRGDRTMLDPLRAGEFELREAIRGQHSTLKCIRSFVRGCRMEAAATKTMLPRSGRATYSAAAQEEANFKHPDPGAHAVGVWAQALFEGYKTNYE